MGTFESQMPLYHVIVDELGKKGYEVEEYENKRDRVRSSVSIKGNLIGDLFIVAPRWYGIFRELEEKVNKEFDHDYCKEFGKLPETLAFYWPNKSLVGAYMHNPVKDYSEIGWMSIVAKIIQEKIPER